MREERITVGGQELALVRPDDPEQLIDEGRFAVDEFMPYWAELWPSGVALARHLDGLDLDGHRVLELGCGLALPSLAAARAGAHVLATDWAPEALALAGENALLNGLRLETAMLDWGAPGQAPQLPFDLVLAADVLYEERNAEPLLHLLAAVVADHGEALVADPGRRHAQAFLDTARGGGWTVGQSVVAELPHGWIASLRPPR